MPGDIEYRGSADGHEVGTTNRHVDRFHTNLGLTGKHRCCGAGEAESDL
jgi:hypothetical protein